MTMPTFARRAGLALLLILVSLLAPAVARGQDDSTYDQEARALLESMSVRERVGQLFLVTFEGDRAPIPSDIADLVLNYQIGGVLLQSSNGNLTGYGDPAATPRQVRDLTANLQSLALLGTSNEPAPENEEADLVPPEEPLAGPGVPVPLLVATRFEGDALPLTDRLPGFSDVPNNMALGATWEPEFARRVGEVVGRDLAATGVNLLLGPALDVLERPSRLSAGDLGTHSFGGDPYWTGLMGRAYVEGVHSGAGSRVAVTATSFPGKGSSDRPVDQEVPTVRRSLDQLRQIELAPFFSVTRDPIGAPTTAEALLATHIRYQGLQGNIRATTAPVSLDPQALTSLMSLPEFTNWRQGGGVIVSDELGARSVERFYDDTEQEFPHRQVAKDALLAGNDVLNVGNFALGDSSYAAELANIKDTIDWFAERYGTDPTFQQRVDDAALRVLKMKLRLYGGDFSPEQVIGPLPVEGDAVLTPSRGDVFFDVAQSAVTLLSPSADELASRLVSPPVVGDNIVIFTDVRDVQPCVECVSLPLLSQTALEDRILALYGPTGSGQVQEDGVTSFSFADLNDYLDAGGAPIPEPTAVVTPTLAPEEEATAETGPSPTPAPTPTLPADFRVQEALRDADWVVFAQLNNGATSAGAPDSDALSRFLSLRPDLARDKQVVVFAFDAPYFLDSTEISKLTAYYGIYSKTGAFVDAAVRALFLESPPAGAPPVSVEGIQYDLFTQTQPDPNQILELYLVIDGEVQSPSRLAPEALAIGDTVLLQTGVVRDHNGHPVPDGTPVRFILNDRVQGTVTVLGDRPTTNGVAQLDYVLDARMGPGQFRITAESGDATVSQEVDIAIEEDARLAIIIPTAAPTATPTATPTPTPTPEPTETPPPPPATGTPPPVEPERPSGLLIELADLQALLSIVVGLVAVLFLAVLVNQQWPARTLTERVGRLLWGLAGGLLLYNYYALGMPGAAALGGFGWATALVLIVAGGLAGLLLYRPLGRR